MLDVLYFLIGPRIKMLGVFIFHITKETKYAILYRENGVVHLSERDCGTVITYFDSDQDNGLNYKE